MRECTSEQSLSYVGVHDSEDMLEWHADLFLNWIAGLLELDEYGHHFPWRAICCLNEPLQVTTLEAMYDEWRFVTAFVDTLKPGSALHTQLAVTRHQSYRDLMTKAEFLTTISIPMQFSVAGASNYNLKTVWKCRLYLNSSTPGMQQHELPKTSYVYWTATSIIPDSFSSAYNLRIFSFDAELMGSDSSIPFRRTLRAFCGLTSDEFTSLLTSLPSELGFNDLRDASRRHQKSEKVNPNNVHSVLLKSCAKRLSGCSALDLDESDWMQPLKGKAIKSRVHAALKPRDVELGLDCSGLTRHRQNAAYTKPHIWCQRLRLLKLLQGSWEDFRGSPEDRCDHVLATFKGLWTSRLVERHCFIQWKNKQSEDVRYLVLSSGPHSVSTMMLQKVQGSSPVCYDIQDDLLETPAWLATSAASRWRWQHPSSRAKAAWLGPTKAPSCRSRTMWPTTTWWGSVPTSSPNSVPPSRFAASASLDTSAKSKPSWNSWEKKPKPSKKSWMKSRTTCKSPSQQRTPRLTFQQKTYVEFAPDIFT